MMNNTIFESRMLGRHRMLWNLLISRVNYKNTGAILEDSSARRKWCGIYGQPTSTSRQLIEKYEHYLERQSQFRRRNSEVVT
jgi:hypothetical protein